jgi:hypothetical protein
VDGFAPNKVLAQLNITDFGVANQHLLTANFAAGATVTDPLEVRLYGWHASGAQGNTHVNLAAMTGRFVGVPTLEFNFAGVQDSSPLTATTFNSANAVVVGGLRYGAGLGARHPTGGPTNAGNEFNAAGFSSETTLAAALSASDYLSFTVQAVEGMAMYTDSVSFTLWRQSAASASRYAVLSSVDGFTAGDELATANYSDFGSDNQHTLTATFATAEPTEDPVEFRLYGYSAATLQDGTHITAASMRARFVSVVGGSISPVGQLNVSGDFYHRAGAELAIELGGTIPGQQHDVLSVAGAVELAGDLRVSLLNLGTGVFTPEPGDEFTVLTAAGGLSGTFSSVLLPSLAEDLDWQLEYRSHAAVLRVVNSADFNADGVVDSNDLTLWRSGVASGGNEKVDGDADNDQDVDGADFLAWQRQLGSEPAIHASSTVPEPSSAELLISILAAAAALSATRGNSQLPAKNRMVC